jgi:hypothetical protein
VTGPNIPADAEEFGEHIHPDFEALALEVKLVSAGFADVHRRRARASMNCGSCIPELKQLLQSASPAHHSVQ